MTPKQTIRALLDASLQLPRHRARRLAWVKETAAAWREAQRQMDDRCTEAVEHLSEEEFERLFNAEQAKVDAFRKPLMDAAERDMWPRELYWGGI